MLLVGRLCCGQSYGGLFIGLITALGGVMKCLNCDNQAVGRSKYCGDSCKVLWNRKQKSVNRKQGITEQEFTEEVSKIYDVPIKLPANFGQLDCECMHCQQSRANNSKLVLNHGPVKSFEQLADNEVNRVSLPGDIDYKGVA